MKLLSYCARNRNDIEKCLTEFKSQCPAKYSAILALVFTADDRMVTLKRITKCIHSAVPDAKIAGCTSSGEIYRGKLSLQTILINFLIFTDAIVETMLLDCEKVTMDEAGKLLLKKTADMSDLRGICLLTTSNTQEKLRIFTDQLTAVPKDVVIFGGAADTYANEAAYVDTEQAHVFDNEQTADRGILAVFFRGEDLNIFVSSHLGWQPLSSEALVTKMKSSTEICTLNYEPTVETYKKYLGISPGPEFFVYAIPFLMITRRDGRNLGRVPARCFANGSMRFGGDFDLGEKVRLGYGDPNAMFRAAKESQKKMREFSPEAILLFSCIVRRMYLKEDVRDELSLYEAIAPTAGFYTYGEFERFEGHHRVHTMNGAFLSIGFREGKSYLTSIPLEDYEKARLEDEYTERHSMVRVLTNFISVMAKELETANRQLSYLADVDRLTQLLNRGAGEKAIQTELERIKATNGRVAAIMGDIDFFKKVNDNFGHEKGDEILREVAKEMKSQVRSNDYVCRWGGEEFVLLLPNCPLENAVKAAERIRSKIEQEVFLPDGKNITMSFGVANARVGDTMEMLYEALDKELYLSKENGRNRVSVAEDREIL